MGDVVAWAARALVGAATRVAWLAGATEEANAERLLGEIMAEA